MMLIIDCKYRLNSKNVQAINSSNSNNVASVKKKIEAVLLNGTSTTVPEEAETLLDEEKPKDGATEVVLIEEPIIPLVSLKSS